MPQSIISAQDFFDGITTPGAWSNSPNQFTPFALRVKRNRLLRAMPRPGRGQPKERRGGEALAKSRRARGKRVECGSNSSRFATLKRSFRSVPVHSAGASLP